MVIVINETIKKIFLAEWFYFYWNMEWFGKASIEICIATTLGLLDFCTHNFQHNSGNFCAYPKENSLISPKLHATLLFQFLITPPLHSTVCVLASLILIMDTFHRFWSTFARQTSLLIFPSYVTVDMSKGFCVKINLNSRPHSCLCSFTIK